MTGALKYRPELDGLRALAVLFVIINHFNSVLMPGGFLGVDMFFVLSGYVVTSSLAERPSQSALHFLRDFYARRMKRILPALLVCIIVAGFVACLFIQFHTGSMKAAKNAIFGLSNIYFFKHSLDYFAEATRLNVFTHTWSLGVEEQFYLVYPALLALFCMHKKWSENAKRVTIALTILSALSLVCWYASPFFSPYFSYYMLPARFWELGLGTLTFFASRHKDLKIPAGAFLAVLALCLYIPQAYAAYTTLAVSLATAGLIWATQSPGRLTKILSSRPMVETGLRSYSLYLWHWPVLVISQHTIGISLYTAPGQIALIVLLAMASYTFIEKPFRSGSLEIKTSGYALLAGLAACLVTLGIVAFLAQKPNKLYWNDKPRFNLENPSFPAAANFMQCRFSGDFDAAVFPPPCYYQPEGSKQTLWIIGDSTAWSLKGMASDLAQKNKLNIAMFSYDAAFPTATMLRIDTYQAPRWRETQTFLTKAYAYMLQWAKPGDIILVSGDIEVEFCNMPELACKHQGSERAWQLSDGTQPTINEAYGLFLSEMKDFTRAAKKQKLHVIVRAPWPVWTPDHKFMCERQWFRMAGQTDGCSKPDFAEQAASRKRMVDILQQGARDGGFLVYDPFPYLCNENFCGYADDNNTNYWIDATHLSTVGGQHLYPDFTRFINEHGILKDAR